MLLKNAVKVHSPMELAGFIHDPPEVFLGNISGSHCKWDRKRNNGHWNVKYRPVTPLYPLPSPKHCVVPEIMKTYMYLTKNHWKILMG